MPVLHRTSGRTKDSTGARCGCNFPDGYSNCDCLAYAQIPEAMPIRIDPCGRQIAHVRVLIERLGVGQISVGHRHRRSRPIRRDEPPQATGVMPCPEVVESSFGIPFFAGELVETACPPFMGRYRALLCR